MEHAVSLFLDALKKVLQQLKPTQQPYSFLLCIGQAQQGKTTLLKQSSLTQVELAGESPAELYTNANGVIIDLNDSWINSNHILLQQLIKEINRCHHAFKINGLLLTLDMNLLYDKQLEELAHTIQIHNNYLKRCAQVLDYRINISIVLTKLDGIAGFSDFFEQEYLHESNKPLGFSLSWGRRNDQLINNYRACFDQFIQSLEQSVLKKIHPVRSNIKRKLIREFPLQLMQLRAPLQALLNALPTQPSRVQAIYFTSAEQGGISIDHLNHKIQQEYALQVRDQFPQATNHRAYFVDGALATTQAFSKQHSPQAATLSPWHLILLSASMALLLFGISAHYLSTKHTLDHVGHELLAYQANQTNANLKTEALFHLTQASYLLNEFTPILSLPPALNTLKNNLNATTAALLKQHFLPTLLDAIEQPLLTRSGTPATLYQTLKVYLLLGDPKLGNREAIIAWFKQYWQQQESDALARDNQLRLLNELLTEPRQPIALNSQLINSVRHYLNALPANYLYYSLAKQQFNRKRQHLDFPGLRLPERSMPYRLTKQGFKQALAQIPSISKTLQTEYWVLERQDLTPLETRIVDAYCYEYALWWQNLLRKTRINPIQSFPQAYALVQQLAQNNTFAQFIALIQAQTGPDFSADNSLFNRAIASQFTAVNLMSKSSLDELLRAIQELQPFLMTLSMVQDAGQTAFSLTKTLFSGEGFNNPLAELSTKINQFPEPIAPWLRQLPEEVWLLLMQDTKHYINALWQQDVYTFYQQRLAHRYPLDMNGSEDVELTDFNQFFSPHGILARFTETYLKPFLDTSSANWALKHTEEVMLPIPPTLLSELMRANVISAMFFPNQQTTSHIRFTLEKINLDPIISRLALTVGDTALQDSQKTHSITEFSWPATDALLSLSAIDGNQYQLEEQGPWALFKLLQKVNVLIDKEDSKQMQILFEINGNSGRYVLRTHNALNPFTPGILNAFHLTKSIISTA